MTDLCLVAMELDRFEEAGEGGDWDRDVADGEEDGDKFGKALQPRSINGMAEAEGLKHAPKAMVEVIAEHGHGDDVKERDGPNLEPEDDIVIDVLLVEGSARMNGTQGELQEVPNNECQDDGAAPHHGARRVGGMDVGLFDVADGAGFALEEPELEGRPNVQGDGEEQGDAGTPQKRGDGFQKCGVSIDFFR